MCVKSCCTHVCVYVCEKMLYISVCVIDFTVTLSINTARSNSPQADRVLRSGVKTPNHTLGHHTSVLQLPSFASRLDSNLVRSHLLFYLRFLPLQRKLGGGNSTYDWLFLGWAGGVVVV